MKMSESITKISPALIKFHSEVGTIEKDGENPYLKTKYATLDSINKTIRPVLANNKLAIMQNVISGDGIITVKTKLLHESSEWMESEGTTLRLQKVDPQGVGAAITYARRYDLSAFLSLDTGEEDDGASQVGDGYEPIPENAITQEQVGALKSKAMQFAKARNQTEQAVYDVLQIKDIKQLNRAQAATAIKQLDAWLAGVKKEQAKGEGNAKTSAQAQS